ncbi:DUF4124 domain-containing protein [bacterium]|nr:DUF4124 domain-containing protein [bacterium]
MKYKPMMIKFIVAAVILGGVLPLLMRGQDGEPVMTVDDWVPDTSKITDGLAEAADDAGDAIESVRDALPAVAGTSLAQNSSVGEVSGGDTIYRWQDEHGVWHFSETADEAVVEAVVAPDSKMVVPAVKVRKPVDLPDVSLPSPDLSALTGLLGEKTVDADSDLPDAMQDQSVDPMTQLLREAAKRFGRGELRDMSEVDQ